MSDPLFSIWEDGYQTYLSGFPEDDNPFNQVFDYVLWRQWGRGYNRAQFDNSTSSD